MSYLYAEALALVGKPLVDDGKGNYTRNDSFSMKIQAEIIDVKPNGTLTIEARKTIDKNGETQSTVLSGVCRIADITQNNR